MRYLRPIRRHSELQPPARSVTVVSPEARDVVFLDEVASIEIITDALRAWGLRVRSERVVQPKVSEAEASPGDTNWQTTRPESRAPGRLENSLSPMWLPIRKPDQNEAVAPWGWFTRAA
jgi:hypothetical protein